jgi:hypothetical protein
VTFSRVLVRGYVGGDTVLKVSGLQPLTKKNITRKPSTLFPVRCRRVGREPGTSSPDFPTGWHLSSGVGGFLSYAPSGKVLPIYKGFSRPNESAFPQVAENRPEICYTIVT